MAKKKDDKKKNATRKAPMKFTPMGAASVIKSKASARSAQRPSVQAQSFVNSNIGGGGGGK
jgi:hypothetical protein